MLSLLAKLPLALIPASIIAGTVLTTRTPPPEAATPSASCCKATPAPHDGIAAAKRAAARAIEQDILRRAIREFTDDEGRPPAHLSELRNSPHFLRHQIAIELSAFCYDPETGTVSVAPEKAVSR